MTSLQWVAQIRRAEPGCSLVLLGCQSDLRYNEKTMHHAVAYEEGLQCARKINAMVYLECSTKTSAGVGDLFEILTKCSVLCDVKNTWKKSHSELKVSYRKQSSATDFSRITTSPRKSSRFRTGLLTTFRLPDRVPA